MNRIIPLVLIACSLLLTLAGCPSNPPPTKLTDLQPARLLPDLADGFGIMAAVREVSFIEQSGFDIAKTVGSATASFKDISGQFQFAYVGDIIVNLATKLEFEDDSTYSFNVDLTDPNDAIFGRPVSWVVEGKNGYPRMKNVVTEWPEVGMIKSPLVFDSTSAYTLEVESISFADTTLFQIVGKDGVIYAQKGGNALSHTFTAEEVESVGSGPSILQVSGFLLEDTIIEDMKMYFLNGHATFEVVIIE